MTNTKKKLSEAKFFYKLLSENNKLFPDFNYYLNAFLNSSRAVTWIMNSEYSKVDGFKDWYEKEKVDEETEQLLKSINTLRVESTKKKPVEANPVAQFTIDENSITDEIKEKIKEINHKRINITISEVGEGPKDAEIIIQGRISGITNSIEDFPNEDILTICENYITELERLIGECEQRFKHLLPQDLKKRTIFNFTNGDILL